MRGTTRRRETDDWHAADGEDDAGVGGDGAGGHWGAGGGRPEEAGLRPAGTHDGAGRVTGAEIRIRGDLGAAIGVEWGRR